MCKNLAVVGIKADKKESLNEFMFAMAPIMTVNDNDGLGYAAMTDGGIFTEHWLDPKDAFKWRHTWDKKDEEFKKKYDGVFKAKEAYRFFTEKPNLTSKAPFAVIMHARMATCEVALKNVHPFYRDGKALIHNGVISNHTSPTLEKLTSTCDSEVILNSYHKHEVNKNVEKIKQVWIDLSGSYACATLTKDDTGKEVLDLFRNGPPLTSCYIKELDAIVICTNKYMVRDAVKQLGWHCGSFFDMEDDTLVRMDAKTGDFISSFKFGHTTSTHWNSQYSHNRQTVPRELGTSTQSTVEEARATLEEEKKTPKMKELAILTKHGKDSMGTENDFGKEYIDGTQGRYYKH